MRTRLAFTALAAALPSGVLALMACSEPKPPTAGTGSSEAVVVDGEEIPSIFLERLQEDELAALQNWDSLEAAYEALDFEGLLDKIKSQVANPSQHILTHDQLRDLTDTEREEIRAMYMELDSTLDALDDIPTDDAQ